MFERLVFKPSLADQKIISYLLNHMWQNVLDDRQVIH